MTKETSKRSTSVRKEHNAVTRTVYCSVQQSARMKEVADAEFAGNVSRALLGRFEEIDELTFLPAHLRAPLTSLAAATNLSIRDYVIKVLTDHAYQHPETSEAPAPAKSAASRPR